MMSDCGRIIIFCHIHNEFVLVAIVSLNYNRLMRKCKACAAESLHQSQTFETWLKPT
jgi:hypothetical protein